MHRTSSLLLLAALALACDDNPTGPPGSMRLDVTTFGLDIDQSYEIVVDGETHVVDHTPLTIMIPDVRAGSHTVTVNGAAPNCTVTGGNTRRVNVPSEGTADVDIAVLCVAATGAVKVVTTASGADLDPNGTTVQVGTETRTLAKAVDSVVVLMPPGAQTVTLSGLAANCTVASNPRTATVIAGGFTRDTARVVFAMTCAATTGSVRVTAATTGTNPDTDGYTVSMDGVALTGTVTSNGERTYASIAPGDHSFQLNGVASNCTVGGANPRTGTVVAGATLQLAFTISCVAVP